MRRSPIGRVCWRLACACCRRCSINWDGREAGRLVLLLEDEERGKHELHLQPSAPLRRLAQFEKQLPPLLDRLMVTAGISELSLQLGELTALQPQAALAI